MAQHISVDLSRLQPEDQIVEDLPMDALDSMSTVGIILDIEQEFRIKISDAWARKIITFRDIVVYVSNDLKK